MTTATGLTLTGPAHALTDHEVAVTWPEVEGVLEFKAFGVAPELEGAVGRLVTNLEGSQGP